MSGSPTFLVFSTCIVKDMADEHRDESYTHSAFINREEAWNIISNQIEVQEQLRTRGQQVLSILSAIAILVAGISLSFNFGISETELESTAPLTPFSEADLLVILEFHQVTAAMLFVLSLILVLAFIIRNYRASRHSSLKPSLGGREDFSISVVTNSNHQDILNENQLIAYQYEEWIASNTEILNRKRTELNLANVNLVYALNCLLLSALLLFHVSSVNLEDVFFTDLVILSEFSVIVLVLWKKRDEWLNFRSWPFTEQQKELFPYLDTGEIQAIILLTPLITGPIFLVLSIVAYSILGLSLLMRLGLILVIGTLIAKWLIYPVARRFWNNITGEE